MYVDQLYTSTPATRTRRPYNIVIIGKVHRLAVLVKIFSLCDFFVFALKGLFGRLFYFARFFTLLIYVYIKLR